MARELPKLPTLPTLLARMNWLIEQGIAKSANDWSSLAGYDSNSIGSTMTRLRSGEQKSIGNEVAERICKPIGVPWTWLQGIDEPSSPAPRRETDPEDDRYDSRPAAIVALRRAGVDEDTLAVLATLRHKSQGDPGYQYWLTDGVAEAREHVRLADVAAAGGRAEVDRRLSDPKDPLAPPAKKVRPKK